MDNLFQLPNVYESANSGRRKRQRGAECHQSSTKHSTDPVRDRPHGHWDNGHEDRRPRRAKMAGDRDFLKTGKIKQSKI
jgi:hypothetical protein